MRINYKGPELRKNAIVDNETAMQAIIPVDTEWYQYVTRLDYAIVEPSIEGGIFEIRDTDGTVYWTENTDGVKKDHLTFGNRGMEIVPGNELQVVVSGSSIQQAKISLFANGYKTLRHVSDE